ncbi:MAG: GIY-YIG nuclease family protein [Alphaproteobacteria bacterium]|nr:GIY-YIG nuclease family protein [Alphaproteobacteria bacterium]
MPDTVKIGITGNLEARIKQLDNTSTPLPFECYYAIKIDSALTQTIEKQLHELFDDERVRPNREFFNLSAEKAKCSLKIVEIMGGINVTPTDIIVENPQDKQALDNARKKRQKFEFAMLDIQPNTILTFRKDNTITCEVVDNTKVNFRGEITSLSNSADIILKEMGHDWSPSGTIWWCLNGKTLDEMRRARD